MKPKKNSFVFKLNKQQKNTLNDNSGRQTSNKESIENMFLIDKAVSEHEFIILLNSLGTFGNVQIKDLNTTQANVWNNFKAKMDLYYGTESYKRLHEIVYSKFANIDMSKVDIQTPLAYIFGYRLSERDPKSFFALDGFLLPPESTAEAIVVSYNFVKVFRNNNNNFVVSMKPIKPDLETIVYVIDCNPFIGFSKEVVDTLATSNVGTVTVYKINNATKRFDLLYENIEIHRLQIVPDSNKNTNRDIRPVKRDCDNTNLFWPIFVTVVAIILTLMLVFIFRKTRRT